ncbi:hypothetical protein OPV22_003072 [Ensete ventricosum]|uniref:Uncharacterized protein n=1 Tax=Ensete ventricosum TaxID=4639 RepID=A0AAV8RZR8_ENSVE|nr:hypothetical protein OPV22_003072 [Ensete ventricosum]
MKRSLALTTERPPGENTQSVRVCLLLRHAVMNGARMAQQKPKRQRSYIPLPQAVLRKVLHSPARWGEKKNAGTRMGGGLLFLFPSLHGSHTTGTLHVVKQMFDDRLYSFVVDHGDMVSVPTLAGSEDELVVLA